MPRLALAHGLLLCTLPFWVACLACAAMHFQTTEGFFSCEFRWRSLGSVRLSTSTMSIQS
ncbi:hypothetical protein KC19_2G072600 [Ceratodon purpureus]|uniref:Uncharacterized protein n=1 Tax=Ceratodon purpureus TaxID=3225 RepID=A0A8T0IR59_CERPU|nr:hypothetical protein KC19_2G072600 [Ceratodon purpureus]